MTAREKRSVLVVEDDALSSFMMEELCEALGIQAEVVDSGEACLQRLSANPMGYDLVLMDIHMPVESGAEATRRIRNQAADPPRKIPVVAVTADQKWADESLRAEYGINAYLPKPVEPNALLEMCESQSF